MTFPALSLAWPMWCVLMLDACRQKAIADSLDKPQGLKLLVAE